MTEEDVLAELLWVAACQPDYAEGRADWTAYTPELEALYVSYRKLCTTGSSCSTVIDPSADHSFVCSLAPNHSGPCVGVGDVRVHMLNRRRYASALWKLPQRSYLDDPEPVPAGSC